MFYRIFRDGGPRRQYWRAFGWFCVIHAAISLDAHHLIAQVMCTSEPTGATGPVPSTEKEKSHGQIHA